MCTSDERDHIKISCSRAPKNHVLLFHLPSSLNQQNPQRPVHGFSEHSLYSHMYAMHTFTIKPAVHSTCCPNQDTATYRVSLDQTKTHASGSSNGCMPTHRALQPSAPLHSPSMDMRNIIISVHILLMPSPIQWHSTWILHSRAKHRPIMKGVSILTISSLPQQTQGSGEQQAASTRRTAPKQHPFTSLATSEASPACPAVYTNLCVQSTPMHHKHEQPKYLQSPIQSTSSAMFV